LSRNISQVGNPEGNRPLLKPISRWDETIKIDLREIGWGDMNWTDLFQNRDQFKALLNTVMNFRFKKMLENSLVAERLMTSQEGVSS
jgi:hypothetical protein